MGSSRIRFFWSPGSLVHKQTSGNLFFSLYNMVKYSSTKIFFDLQFQCHLLFKSGRKIAYKLCLLKINAAYRSRIWIWISDRFANPDPVKMVPDPQHWTSLTDVSKQRLVSFTVSQLGQRKIIQFWVLKTVLIFWML